MEQLEGEGRIALLAAAVETCDIDAAFETLPCMALIERGGLIVARNGLSRRITGFLTASGLEGSTTQRVNDVLLSWHEVDETDRRVRFDCLVIRRHGAPMPVYAVAQAAMYRGEAC